MNDIPMRTRQFVSGVMSFRRVTIVSVWFSPSGEA